MGIASRYFDGDGFPEYVLTSMADNKLQTRTDFPHARCRSIATMRLRVE